MTKRLSPNDDVNNFLKIYDCDACTTKLHMLVAISSDIGYRRKILTDKLAEDARTRAVEYAYPAHSHQYGIVDEVGDGMESLVATHTAHIQVLLEMELALVDDGTAALSAIRQGGHHGSGRRRELLGCRSRSTLQPFGTHLGTHVTKDDGGHLAIHHLDGSYRGQPLDTHRVASLQRTLVSFLTDSSLTQLFCRLPTLLCFLQLAFLVTLLALLYLSDFAGYQLVVCLGIYLTDFLLEAVQVFTDAFRLLLLCLTLTYLADGISIFLLLSPKSS